RHSDSALQSGGRARCDDVRVHENSKVKIRLALLLQRACSKRTLTERRPNRLAFVQFAMKMSILCPFTLLPVSITVYTPAAGPSTMRTTEPIGSTRGSAERMPVCALRPDSVRP